MGEGGCWGGAACIWATLILTPTSPGHLYPPTVYGGGVAAAADDGLDFGSGKCGILLQYMASRP